MGRTLSWIVAGIFSFCALLTAVSGFASGVTVKTIFFRSIISGLIGGSIASLMGLRWLNRNVSARANPSTPSRIDIRVSDEQTNAIEFQPLPVEQIDDEEARIFPNRK
jgi:hypothetical protein